tara:strand:+ start:165 stop:608 length:444 start_codon:yes stop_codon:yes gene_type:complete
MDFEKFLTNHAEDFKGRNLDLIWQFSDAEIECNHDFIQLIFPTNKRSQNSFHGYYLDNEQVIEKLKNNVEVKANLLKSAAWFLGFLSRNKSWINGYDHNQLRITRVIESLRLLVSDEAANEFFQSILSLVKDPAAINPTTIKFWEEA